jgi:hypothetical protein
VPCWTIHGGGTVPTGGDCGDENGLRGFPQRASRHWPAFKLVLEIIAERIIAAAGTGERDSVRLREAALRWLAR